MAEDEIRTCSYEIFPGSTNPDSPNFGPPELCEADALEGSDYCEAHDWAAY